MAFLGQVTPHGRVTPGTVVHEVLVGAVDRETRYEQLILNADFALLLVGSKASSHKLTTVLFRSLVRADLANTSMRLLNVLQDVTTGEGMRVLGVDTVCEAVEHVFYHEAEAPLQDRASA